jgi:hypothetical protein
MTHLPSEGRRGDPPSWPLGRQSRRETQLWSGLWQTPQAVMWERLGWVDVVARYVRIVAQAEQPKASSAVRSQAQQLEDRLGLTPMSMLRLRWEVGDQVESGGEQQQEGVLDIRDRLQAVE